MARARLSVADVLHRNTFFDRSMCRQAVCTILFIILPMVSLFAILFLCLHLHAIPQLRPHPRWP
jgi:hypothetical protein